MKKIRLRTVSMFLLAGFFGAVLLYTSQAVHRAEDDLAALDEAVDRERDSIRLLKAEWAYLNNPERLESLARKYLEFALPDSGALASSVQNIPVKNGVLPSGAQVQPAVYAPSLPHPSPSGASSPDPEKPFLQNAGGGE